MRSTTEKAEKSGEKQRGLPTIDDLITSLKLCKLAFGGDTRVDTIRWAGNSSCSSLSGVGGFMVIKTGRGKTRRYQLEAIYNKKDIIGDEPRVVTL